MATKTPVKELYERLWEAEKDKFTWNAILKEILEKEKEHIVLAHINGQSEFDNGAYRQKVIDNADHYYNSTFNTKER